MSDFWSTMPDWLPLTPPPQAGQETLTFYGSPMTAAQFLKSRAPRRRADWVRAAAVIVWMLASLSMGMTAYEYVGQTEGVMVFAMTVCAAVLCVIGNAGRARNRRRRDVKAWKLYEAATAGGVITTVYPDRVEQVSARWRETVPLCGQTVYYEFDELMMVECDGRRVVWRADDLTPSDAQRLFEQICIAVSANRQYMMGRFHARRREEMPPPFAMTPPVCYDTFTYEQAFTDPDMDTVRHVTPWLMAAAISAANVFATVFSFTGGFLADYLICLGAAFLCFAAVAVVTLRRRYTNEQITLSFTSEGLHILSAHKQMFVAPADVHPRRTENGAQLDTPAGQFIFPWNRTHNRQQLEWMLFPQQ